MDNSRALKFRHYLKIFHYRSETHSPMLCVQNLYQQNSSCALVLIFWDVCTLFTSVWMSVEDHRQIMDHILILLEDWKVLTLLTEFMCVQYRNFPNRNKGNNSHSGWWKNCCRGKSRDVAHSKHNQSWIYQNSTNSRTVLQLNGDEDSDLFRKLMPALISV